jgi:hypothetical protein
VFLVTRGDVAAYLGYIDQTGPMDKTYFLASAYNRQPRKEPPMLRGPRAEAKLVEFGFVRDWREKSWPPGCRPLGETDFECGRDAAKVH